MFTSGSKTKFYKKYIVAQSFFDEISFLIDEITVGKVVRFERHMKKINNPHYFKWKNTS